MRKKYWKVLNAGDKQNNNQGNERLQSSSRQIGSVIELEINSILKKKKKQWDPAN